MYLLHGVNAIIGYFMDFTVEMLKRLMFGLEFGMEFGTMMPSFFKKRFIVLLLF